MGLVKKASTLFEAICRYRNDGKNSRRSKQSEVKRAAARKEKRTSVPASNPRRLRSEPRKSGTVAATMAETAIFSRQYHDLASHGTCNPSAMEVPRPIQLVEDDDEEEEGEEDMVERDSYDEYEEEDDDIDDSVVEDMRKLEESFKGISQKYRLINRIGEGTIHKLLSASISRTDRAQERSLQSTRPSNCFERRTIMTTRTI
jgi:hypothetical protein